MSHACHAHGCKVDVPPRMLMCRKHWRMVPRRLQQQVWAHYEEGQEDRKDPTTAYLDAADAAIESVYDQEVGHGD